MKKPFYRADDPRPLYHRADGESITIPAAVVWTPFGSAIATLYAIDSGSYAAAPVPPWYDGHAERLAADHNNVPVLRRPFIALNLPARLYRLSDVCDLVSWRPWEG